MAAQGHQKLRKNPSPSFVKQGPLKATKPYILKVSPSGSPTTQWSCETHKKNRRSPDHRSSPDRTSSPGIKGLYLWAPSKISIRSKTDRTENIDHFPTSQRHERVLRPFDDLNSF